MMKIVGEKLNLNEMKNVKGGKMYSCHCGFVGDGYGSFSVSAPSLGDALSASGAACGGRGATCSG